MYIIRLLCLTSLRIINALNEESCLFIENNKSFELKYTNTTYACMKQKLSAKQQCESHRFSNEVTGPESTKWHPNSKFSKNFERICKDSWFKNRIISVECTSCSSKVDDTTVAINCPSVAHIYEKVDHVNVKQNSRMNWLCKVIKPVNDRTTESHGIPDYVFIVGGIVGVLVVTCIIVGVFLLRKRNCSDFRNTQMTVNDQEMPTVNPTYIPAGRPNKHENHHQANLVNAPGGSNLSTTPAVYFDNRTDDKAIKLCSIQQPGIQTNKHESNTYSHLRTTTDDSDDMYDHTVRNAVRNTCDGDYGVAHIKIIEDDYNVSGNYPHPLTNKEDPVYT